MALQRGYSDPRWMTYKQASDQGWQVRRGEKGTQIEFWEVKPADKDATPGENAGAGSERNGRDGRDTRLIHRVYTVFNAKQIDGIPEYQPKRPTPFEVVNSAEQDSGQFWRQDHPRPSRPCLLQPRQRQHPSAS
jgi:antirestriction protein ArdC